MSKKFELTAEQIDFIRKVQEQKTKKNEACKKWRDSHPLAYNNAKERAKEAREAKKAEYAALMSQLESAGVSVEDVLAAS